MQKELSCRFLKSHKKIFIYFPFLLLLFGSCSNQTKETLFSQLPSSKTNITFKNQVNEDEDWNIIKYLYYYNGGGVAVGDLNNDGLPDVYFTANQAPNKLYINEGGLEFKDITDKAGVAGHHGESAWKTGVTLADVNADGWLDIYVCQVGFYKAINGRNELYINNQDGTFSERAIEYGLDFKGFSQQASFFDYDLDGDLDMFLLNHSVHSSETFSNAENRMIRDSMSGDRLYRNDAGVFKDVSLEAGIYGAVMGYGLGVVTADLNNDGYQDIYVSNDFHENDYLYYNNGNGTFTEDIKNSIGHSSSFSMGCDIADINNDGWLDILTLDMKPEAETILKASAGMEGYNQYQNKISRGYEYQFPRNCLQLNRGGLFPAPPAPKGELPPEVSGSVGSSSLLGLGGAKRTSFSEIAQLSGLATTDWSWSPLIADFDNDGWKDVFITNGIMRRPNDLDYLNFAANETVNRTASDMELAAKMPSGIAENYAFQNNGDLTFEDVSEKWGLNLEGYSHGAAYADFDNDGDLDLVVNNLNTEAAIYRNNLNEREGGNWLKINLVGKNKNPFGHGARVSLEMPDGQQYIQEVTAAKGWQSSINTELIFGFGRAEKVSRVLVDWGGKDFQSMEDIEANQLLIIREDDRGGQYEFDPKVNHIPDNILEDVSDSLDLPFVHKENRFADYNVERLLPHMFSKEGPKMAVGDVNNDGLDDFFVGGAKANAGALFIQKEGKVPSFFQTEASKKLFEKDKMQEDVDATFLDVEGDGDMDLYVVSGGGEYLEGSKLLQDRLYLNDGNGTFSKAKNVLPEFFVNGSCVKAVDFNEDGAMDLFVGSRSVPRSYGVSPMSYVLLNNGDGTFSNGIEELLPGGAKIGMVTDALWIATEKKLVVVGEWMPITIYHFDGATVNKTELEQTKGWWNTISAGDFDGDGDQDLLAGNFGLNSNLRTRPEQPAQLYLKDFDSNHQIDPVLTYFRQDSQWVFPSKDQLLAQIIPLRKRFVDYQLFANSTFEKIFTPEMLEGAIRKEVETFESLYLENLGAGSYTIHPLPIEAQFAPMQSFLTGDFNNDGNLDALAVGNFYEYEPNIGKMDASYGTYLYGYGNGSFDILEPKECGFAVFGDTRDIKSINISGANQLIIVSRNNNSLQFFK